MVLQARRWLGSHDRGWLRGDVGGGITLAAYLLPAAIGDASLAGLAPQAELYACVCGGLVFWLFCTAGRRGRAVRGLLIGAHQTVDDVVAEWPAAPAGAADAGGVSSAD
jgi:sulfate permease family protein